jgi:hypothetical protein
MIPLLFKGAEKILFKQSLISGTGFADAVLSYSVCVCMNNFTESPIIKYKYR